MCHTFVDHSANFPRPLTPSRYYTDDDAGMLKYGTGYKSAAWLVRQHLNGAASRECDHWHDDAGVINHHVGITWELEVRQRARNDGH